MPAWVEARPSRWAALKATLAGVEQWLLPGACLLCDEVLSPRDRQSSICELCRIRWRRIPDPLCVRCGQPLLQELECRLCAEWPAGLSRVRSAVWLESSAREAVHRLKYDGWTAAAEAMARVMIGLEPLTPGVCLIPVPLGRRRLRQRGYNQAACIAHALSHHSGLPLRADLLERARETPTQTALTPEARLANVSGAFRAGPVRGLSIVLVDDVFTTGATIAAVASALLTSGAERVEAVTFARALVGFSQAR